MNASSLILISIVFFIVGYKLWGKYVSSALGIEENRKTPAESINDGIDYVPTKPSVLMGHHFSSIAGAAPIIGPVTAVVFGWWAVYLWIVLGGLFMGAVHDFSSLVVSVRHGGQSLGKVIEQRMGKASKILFLLFVYSTLLLVMAVFTNAVAKTFNKVPQTGTASLLFIISAVFFGYAVYRLRWNFILSTIMGLTLLILSIYAGFLFPVKISVFTWKFIILAYVFVASVLPVWILLQPRDYLNSFILYLMLGGLVIGIVFVNPELKYPSAPVWTASGKPLFPLLFVTVACGALSGFHSLVASGTTSKQLASEAHAKPVGFGSMLVESILAIGALITAAMLTKSQYKEVFSHGSITLFSQGSASLLTHLGLPFKAGVTFMSLAVAAFALTSLDTATRLGRFAFQELFQNSDSSGTKITDNRFVATAITVGAGGILVFSGTATDIWPIFGSANQLLASLAFLAVTVWLIHMKKPSGFTAIPGILIYFVTITALFWNVYVFTRAKKYPLAFLAIILILLAVFLGIEGIKIIKKEISKKDV